MDNKRKYLIKIILVNVLITSLLFISFGEIFVRLSKKVNRMTPQRLKEQSMEYSPSVFARHVFPQKEQKMTDMYWKGHWGNPNRYINQHGYRGKLFDIEKNPDTIRVMVYGGSAVFDLALPEEKDWPHRIEQYLHQKGLNQVEVINAGIPGHASFDSLGRLFSEGHLLKPDYVVLYNSWNDIKRFHSDKFLLRELKPHASKSNPLLYAQNSFDQFLITHSFLYIFLRHNYLTWKLKVGPEGAAGERPDRYELNQMALDQFQLNIELFIDCARNIAAEPVIMTQGRLIGFHNEQDHP